MNKLRIMQLIDSLHAGGAERMAVNLANELSLKIKNSYLCATREEGLLKESISQEVNYLFLNKTKTLDFKAIKKLRKYIKDNKIDIIHTHSSSYFIATIIKFLDRKLKIIWHDHYGNSEFLYRRKSKVLNLCSYRFFAIISVNEKLENWSKQNLNCKKVYNIPNFVSFNEENKKTTKLKGVKNKRIICLANLRLQKDHLNLLKAFKLILLKAPNWTLHLVGKDFNDEYSKQIKDYIKDENLNQSIFIYGSRQDISNILSQSTIGVLSSKSEGLPVALLEYGFAKLSTICTNVGDCKELIENNKTGFIVEPKNSISLANSMISLIKNNTKRENFSKALFKKVNTKFDKSKSIDKLMSIYKNCLIEQ